MDTDGLAIFHSEPLGFPVSSLVYVVQFFLAEAGGQHIASPKIGLLGDMVCTLQEMEWGDHRYLLKADGSSRWDELRKGHYACEFYVSTGAVEQRTVEPFKNFHPDELMAAYGTLIR